MPTGAFFIPPSLDFLLLDFAFISHHVSLSESAKRNHLLRPFIHLQDLFPKTDPISPLVVVPCTICVSAGVNDFGQRKPSQLDSRLHLFIVVLVVWIGNFGGIRVVRNDRRSVTIPSVVYRRVRLLYRVSK